MGKSTVHIPIRATSRTYKMLVKTWEDVNNHQRSDQEGDWRDSAAGRHYGPLQDRWMQSTS
jgi:hypothetical protein